MPLFDTHCHLDLIEAGHGGHDKLATTLVDVVKKAGNEDVTAFVNPCVSLEDLPQVLSVAERFPQVFAAVGQHPCDTETLKSIPDWDQRLIESLQHPKVVAIGETGLDYYWHKENFDHQAFQRESFIRHLKLGKQHNLPVIVHDREAHDDIRACIETAAGVRGIMHCFSGDAAFAQTMVEAGFYISFAGNVTFKKAQELRDAAKAVPLERLLIETDSPYLSPMPERGKPNEPYRVSFVADCLAEVKQLSKEVLAEQTWQNALTVFQLKEKSGQLERVAA